MLIAEGKVIEKKSFWNNEHTMIYTANTIEVYKLFKGNLVEKKYRGHYGRWRSRQPVY